MDILRVTARWTGFTGAPGYSVFHFTTEGGFWDGGLLGDQAQVAAEAAVYDVGQGFGQLAAVLPDGVRVEVEQEAHILDSDTGEILGFANTDGFATTGDGTSGSYSAPTGAVITWNTNDYRFGRRIRGRTFLVPLDGGAYEADGTLTSDAIDRCERFGNRIVDGSGSASFGVWSRPRGGSGGVFATAVGYRVPDMAAVLRSRRD